MGAEVTIESFFQECAKKTDLSLRSVKNTLQLLIQEECTVPFVARYRKEVTGDLDEVQIRALQGCYEEILEREERRVFILDTIQKMEKMTPELKLSIERAENLQQLEDIYAPYKSKKKTKAQLALEAGLGPVADLFLDPKISLKEIEALHNEEALKGVSYIWMERFAHHVAMKEILRQEMWRDAVVVSKKHEDAEKNSDESHKFKDFFEYQEKLSALKEAKSLHRFMALRRGMTEKVLSVEITYPSESVVPLIAKTHYANLPAGDTKRAMLDKWANSAWRVYLHPSLELEINSEMKKLGDDASIEIFKANLKNLLLSPYLGSRRVMGVDPGVRTGCKIAVVDETGKFLFDFVIYPHPPQEDKRKSKEMLEAVIEKFQIKYIAIGSGTYGRETLQFFKENLSAVKNEKVQVSLISEAGASVYSASEIAGKEFPNLDVTVRGAISIARRFQDPLAELVKIDPKSIGVGQYQHDVNQSKLKKSLEGVVEGCVNFVGVDLNTASAPLLSYVSGISKTLSERVVDFRDKKGTFKSRRELLGVPYFSEKVFEQAAGFLRIVDGVNPLDATFVHPERYPLLETWAEKKKIALKDLAFNPTLLQELQKDKEMKEQLGEFTLQDIVKSLSAKGQDPRTEFKPVEFRADLNSINDVVVNQWYQGVVNNITQFGAFVDIGIKESGLLHISEFSSKKFVENPLDHLKVGQEVKVKVIGVDKERKRISLSMKAESTAVRSTPMPQTQVKNNALKSLKNFKVS